jgi:hypothetical protein
MESLSHTAILKKFGFLCPFIKKKTCFALDQLYIELKTKSLFTTTSNVLPFKFKCFTAIYRLSELIARNLVILCHI